MSQIRNSLAAAAMTAAVAMAGAGCSSPRPAVHTTTAGHNAVAPSSSAPATRTSAPKAAAGLTGKWAGHYSGTYNGTFVLHWRQTGSQLKGRIRISTPPSTLAINGVVKNGSIRFGTVGSTAITYSGTVSGDSMSGHWAIHGSSGGGGPWSASKA